MKLFADTIQLVEETNNTNEKTAALARFFKEATDQDKVWAVAILTQRRPKRPVKTSLLRSWAAELAGIDLWLFEESYNIVGDLAETIALLVSVKNYKNNHGKSLSDYLDLIIAMKDWDEKDQKSTIQSVWKELDFYSSFIFNKLITGGFRIDLSRKLMIKSLAIPTGIDEGILAHQIIGKWSPQTISFQELILDHGGTENFSTPYPYYLAYDLEGEIADLGPPEAWQAEWKWDGIRGQLIKRGGEIFVWSRGEELVTDKYPELESLKESLPDGTVLDGEILPFRDGNPLIFNELKRRIGRLKAVPKLLKDVPIIFMAYDILEYQGKDIRDFPLKKRRKELESMVSSLKMPHLKLSPTIQFPSWKHLINKKKESRANKVEGLMLKHLDGTYKTGRVKGEMWKWKVEPYSVDAVLTYVTRGHRRQAKLYSDYTFGLWEGNKLVTFAKVYPGLTDDELQQVDHYVKQNTIDRFGPVRQVVPSLVFELVFEGIAKSTRHKSGVVTRFPRIKRWRKDKGPQDANSLKDILSLLGHP